MSSNILNIKEIPVSFGISETRAAEMFNLFACRPKKSPAFAGLKSQTKSNCKLEAPFKRNAEFVCKSFGNGFVADCVIKYDASVFDEVPCKYRL